MTTETVYLNAEYQRRALAMLCEFARRRPRLDVEMYDTDQNGRRCYCADQRQNTRALHDFNALYSAVYWRTFTRKDIREAFRSAFSGRLSLRENGDGMPAALHYCAGQYRETEYRFAACAVLKSLIWYAKRESMPDGIENGGDWIRAELRREFGRGIASRWFN